MKRRETCPVCGTSNWPGSEYCSTCSWHFYEKRELNKEARMMTLSRIV
ncbi:MAG: hypothetical protein ACOC5A_00215 [Halanaerobiales bacterium]